MSDSSIEQIESSLNVVTPLGRVGQPRRAQGVAVFLASDASNYITGQTIVVDGGGTIATGILFKRVAVIGAGPWARHRAGRGDGRLRHAVDG
jgi:enoyl-[acyl-carrier-protein] reductase (NADH)